MIEDLLGKDPKKITASDSVKGSLAEKGYGTADEIGKTINAPRNFLKHADIAEFDHSAADLQSMAITEITLALTNLCRLDRSVVSEGRRFLDWISVNWSKP